MVPDSLLALAEDLIDRHKNAQEQFVIVETSLGGLASATLTTIPGASHLLERAYIPYANEAKYSDLGISPALIAEFGAVSQEAAIALAEGGLAKAALARVCYAETGICGPGGGSVEKPVGTVFLARAEYDNSTEIQQYQFKGDRRSIRVQTVAALLNWMWERH